ncbi:MAG TPA: 16S rRNA (uracil(1498)-N(3))-methyltransferase [Methylomirabilota bacterium]|nr:16S rRNA (uracil(1498)-N(3))-methyltransferase [Methylomirabilota bacterium]
MSRFHVRPEAVRGERVAFDAEEAHHLARVLRLGSGDLVAALDGAGNELTVRLTRVGTRGAEGLVLSRRALQTESALDLTLAQGIPKGDKMEGIIRMVTELGVTRIVPLITERALVTPEAASRRLTRWRRVAKEAAKQSGRAVIPDVTPPQRPSDWLVSIVGPRFLLCLWENERTPLDERLPAARPARAAVVVGPEGGLTESEVARLGAAGAVVAGLGPRILRTETAGPVAVALLQSRYGDLGTSG